MDDEQARWEFARGAGVVGGGAAAVVAVMVLGEMVEAMHTDLGPGGLLFAVWLEFAGLAIGREVGYRAYVKARPRPPQGWHEEPWGPEGRQR